MVDKSIDREKLLSICFWRFSENPSERKRKQIAPPSRHFHGSAILSIIALDQSARGKSLSYDKKGLFDQSEATNQIRLELLR